SSLGLLRSSLGSVHAAALLKSLARDSALRSLGLLSVLAVFLLWGTRRLGAAWLLVLALSFHAWDQKAVYDRFVLFIDPGKAISAPSFKQAPPPPPGVVPWRIYDPDPSGPNKDMLLGYDNLCGRASMPMLGFQGIAGAFGPRWQDWFNLYNVRYIFEHARSAGVPATDTVTVWKNPGALGRAWLVGRSHGVGSDGDAFHLLADPRFEYRSEVALPIGTGPDLEGPAPKGNIQWLARTPQSSSLLVSTDRDSILVLSNSWYPSWKADVDGRSSPVLKADGGLQALRLGPGLHRIQFHFDQGLFNAALIASAFGLFVLFLLGFCKLRGRENL
ncbi:MAG: hypothetical protein ACREKE_06475, partial [bacterium]